LVRVPLAAGYPVAGELLAAQVVVVTQVVASAILFPFLLSRVPAAVVVVATAWPFTLLGGVLSATPAAGVAAGGMYVSAWITALWAWKAASPARYSYRSVGAATLLTVGSLLLFYLRLDFGTGAPAETTDLLARWAPVSPPLAALRLLDRAPPAMDWCVPAMVGCAASARLILTQRRRQVIHRIWTDRRPIEPPARRRKYRRRSD
jgi:hypothetical protein